MKKILEIIGIGLLCFGSLYCIIGVIVEGDPVLIIVVSFIFGIILWGISQGVWTHDYDDWPP